MNSRETCYNVSYNIEVYSGPKSGIDDIPEQHSTNNAELMTILLILGQDIIPGTIYETVKLIQLAT